jgi:hypothetical protein
MCMEIKRAAEAPNYLAPLAEWVPRDLGSSPGKAGFGMRTSHRDAEEYLDWYMALAYMSMTAEDN